MSFNIRHGRARDGENSWEHRQQLVADTIRQAHVDLLGAQEVRDFQADYLREQLQELEFYGVGRDDGDRSGEFSPIFFRRDRFDLRDSGTIWLSETPDRPGSKSWDADLPRIATWVRLHDRLGARHLLFINMHWDHIGQVARLESARLLRRKLVELGGRGPVIVTGDLNTHEDADAFHALVMSDHEETKLIDSYRAVHPEQEADEASFHGFLGTTSGQRIDFIFHTPHFKTDHAAIDRAHANGRWPSDHYPVTAVLSWG
jgi:endonuclease/exonuclease/phosphatase family metal-dependent hydrolase